MLFEQREKSFLFFSLFSLISYLEKSREISEKRKVKSEKRRVQKEKAAYATFLFGGDEENRTPVRKPIHTTFSVGSLSFRIPP